MNLMIVKKLVAKMLIVCFVAGVVVSALLGYDVVEEKRFISRAVQLVGENECEIEKQFPRMYMRNNNVVHIYRQRILPFLCGWFR